MKEDDTLDYQFIPKEYLISILDELKIKQDNDNLGKKEIHILNKLEYCLCQLINSNKNYLKRLIRQIDDLIRSNPTDISKIIETLITLDKKISYLASELINIGFSKAFLTKLVRSLFVFKPKDTFDESWDEFKSVIQGPKKEFIVVFKIMGSKKQLDRIQLLKKNINFDILGTSPTKKSENFIKSNENLRFLQVEVEAFDYL